jgi:DNA-directed RNA polymerase specialized sigma24 family protein
LPAHEREDIRQDLLVDALARIRAFDPRRGSFGAFVGAIVAHRLSRLAKQVYRQRALQTVLRESFRVAPSDPAAERDPLNAERFEIAAQPGEQSKRVDSRLDLERCLGSLNSDDLALCLQLAEYAPTEICHATNTSRAGVYRRIKEIRMQMLTKGLSAAA